MFIAFYKFSVTARMGLENLFNLQFLMFAELLVGYTLQKIGFIDVKSGKTLSKLVVNVLLPCETVVAFTLKMNSSILSQCLHVLLISIFLQALSLVIGNLSYRKEPEGRKIVLEYGTLCSNAGVLGNAISDSLYGASGLLYASIYLIPLRIMMWSVGVSYFTKSTNPEKVLKKVLTHPCIISLEIGMVLLITQFKLPTAVTNTLSSLGGAVMPLTMLFLGITLADSGLKGMVCPASIKYAVIRLVLIPAAVLAGCKLFSVESTAAAICVVLAAMPMGSSTALLASQYDGDVSFATHCVVFTTLLSLAALPVWIMIIGAVFHA